MNAFMSRCNYEPSASTSDIDETITGFKESGFKRPAQNCVAVAKAQQVLENIDRADTIINTNATRLRALNPAGCAVRSRSYSCTQYISKHSRTSLVSLRQVALKRQGTKAQSFFGPDSL
jgi:hypothetical protein